MTLQEIVTTRFQEQHSGKHLFETTPDNWIDAGMPHIWHVTKCIANSEITAFDNQDVYLLTDSGFGYIAIVKGDNFAIGKDLASLPPYIGLSPAYGEKLAGLYIQL